MENALQKKRDGKGYDRHHRIPRSMGGSDSKNNVVRLTRREHFVAHLLLIKMTSGRFKKKMIRSAFLMSCQAGVSRKYQKLRDEYSEQQSAMMRKKYADGWKSPFADPAIHRKTIAKREAAGTNVFSTNNPMHDPEKLEKKVAKTRGLKNYFRKRNRYFFSTDGSTWNELKIVSKLDDTLLEKGWDRGAFYMTVNSGKPAKKGTMKGIWVRKEVDENYKNREV